MQHNVHNTTQHNTKRNVRPRKFIGEILIILFWKFQNTVTLKGKVPSRCSSKFLCSLENCYEFIIFQNYKYFYKQWKHFSKELGN
jgi:hypothetical protein